jgi:hypothetical protein
LKLSPSLVGSLARVGTRDFCPALATIVGLVQNMCFFTIHYFTSFVLIAQQAGQTVMPGHLSLNMRLWLLRYSCIVQHKHPVVLISVTEAELIRKNNIKKTSSFFEKSIPTYSTEDGKSFKQGNVLIIKWKAVQLKRKKMFILTKNTV